MARWPRRQKGRCGNLCGFGATVHAFPWGLLSTSKHRQQGVHMSRSASACCYLRKHKRREGTSSAGSPVKQHRGPTRNDTTGPLRRSVQEQDRVAECPWHGQRGHEVGQWTSSWWSGVWRQESERHETHEYSKQRRANPERVCEAERRKSL